MQIAPADIRALQVFRAVVDHQGFLGAQVALGLSQPAISQHLRSLEERLGAVLCHRGRQGFALTEQGRLVYEESRPLFSALGAFNSAVQHLGHDIRGMIRLGVVDNTITNPDLPVPVALHRFGLIAPKVSLGVRVSTPEDLITELSNGNLDIAVMPAFMENDGIVFIPVIMEYHALFCSRAHPLYHRADDPGLSCADVAAHPFVVRRYASSQDLTDFPGAQATAAASNMEAQAILILSGRYIGFLPEHYARIWRRDDELRCVGQSRWRQISRFGIAVRRSDRQSAAQKILIRELLSACRGVPDAV
ncbi:LysR family transcriptional regulator [Komagataeibacter sp. FNDCF1]|uniref:LysR family transcriptional regulator n=1 Tax=Komagataeibacter sp. FNDCF1 TaxID=2878681 RepID=UPI001E2BDD52|nr:LysR family transcriptional regulator [Komagataeibacter sp. FNDCF1]MCE2563253.1 LysR family transcriptional regulator [Komagataeibacter sp. FNDCF1]